ncbi:MAG: hypothetical protein ACF788_03710, partial [Novipirellula sp. JB048]
DMPASSETERETCSQFVDPLITYDHRYGRAIVGGRVYRGDRFPELHGAYLYGDYASGIIWASHYDGQQVTQTSKLASPKVSIAGFGQDANQEIYVCALDGIIYRFRKIDTGSQEPSPPFPEKLSETKLFASLENLTPAAGMIPYSVNVPMWSDGAVQHRYIALPKSGQVQFSIDRPWQFPVGTVFVRHLSISVTDKQHPIQHLETRLLVHGRHGWDGYSYVWNEQQNDAELVELPPVREIEVATEQGPDHRHWNYLTREQCNVCHSKANGIVLGVNTRQLNRLDSETAHSTNQLQRLADLGIFQEPLPADLSHLSSFPDWPTRNASIKELARAYLAVNCAVCHVRDRLGITEIDLRYDTLLADTRLVGERPRRPKSTRSAARHALIDPGRPAESELLRRLKDRGEDRMPPLGRSIPDQTAVEVIRGWIAGMRDQEGHFDPEVIIAMKPEVTLESPIPGTYNTEFVRRLVWEVRESGDPRSGRAVFESDHANCKACHLIGSGSDVAPFAKGPDLAGVGSEHSLESLIESVLWPQRTIKEGYELTAVLLGDGRVISGYVESETDQSITIRDILTNRSNKIDQTEIEASSATGSAMPATVASQLSRAQLIDLIAFLHSLHAATPARPGASKPLGAPNQADVSGR